jgi:hypothetical protein
MRLRTLVRERSRKPMRLRTLVRERRRTPMTLRALGRDGPLTTDEGVRALQPGR